MNRKQRDKNRATAKELRYKNPPTRTCPNCGVRTHQGHYAPPSYNWPGIWICFSTQELVLMNEIGRLSPTVEETS